jgi:hypothetical protein
MQYHQYVANSSINIKDKNEEMKILHFSVFFKARVFDAPSQFKLHKFTVTTGKYKDRNQGDGHSPRPLITQYLVENVCKIRNIIFEVLTNNYRIV